ncbi:MAG: cobyric acid synthase [Halodesulfurarchaeum sp.]
MTETILLAGTGSHVGKSVLAAGLCRSLRNRGVTVVPFKAQNMSNNARVVVSPTEEVDEDTDGNVQSEWGEIGVSQYVQARAAGVTPTTDMNPVLLKPRGDGESQLVVHGHAREHLEPGAYYGGRWEDAREAAESSFRRLAAEYDVVVAEGAGSIAEINLRDRDLANVETARFADARIILVGDIERGGVFASLWGTLELMPDDVRDRVVGVVINKFRGSRSVLEPGIEEFESMAGIPVLGVVPYEDPGLPEEDSVSLPDRNERTVFGAAEGHQEVGSVTVGVPRFPFVSNFTDLEPLALEPGVRVVYLPLDSTLDEVDAVVLPGSKNTFDDLLALREAGFDDELRRFDGPVIGICGGYQMLGELLRRTEIESTQVSGSVEGIGILPVETTFVEEKVVTRTTCDVSGVDPIATADGTVSGYEIHVGRTRFTDPVDHPLEETSAAAHGVLGTYLHGLFENDDLRDAFVATVFEHAGQSRSRWHGDRPSPYERAGDLFETYVDLDRITEIESSIS